MRDVERGPGALGIALELSGKCDIPEVGDDRHQQVQNMPEIRPQCSAAVDSRKEWRAQVAEPRCDGHVAHRQEVVDASRGYGSGGQAGGDRDGRLALPVEPALERRRSGYASFDRIEHARLVDFALHHKETPVLAGPDLAHAAARDARHIAHGRLATAQPTPMDRPVRRLHVDTAFRDAVQKQEEGHVEVGERLHLAFCQFDRLRRAQRQDDGTCVASVRVVGILYQLVQHPVAVLGADPFVQVPETLVDLEFLPVRINGVAQHVPKLRIEVIGGK